MKGAGLQLISRVELTLIEKQFSSIFFPFFSYKKGMGGQEEELFSSIIKLFFFPPRS